MSARWYVVSKAKGLVACTNDQDWAEHLAFIAAVDSGLVWLHDRRSEL